MEKEGPQVCIFFNFNPPFPLEYGQNRKLHIFTRKKFRSLFSFPGKILLRFRLFELFFGRKQGKVTSQRVRIKV